MCWRGRKKRAPTTLLRPSSPSTFVRHPNHPGIKGARLHTHRGTVTSLTGQHRRCPQKGPRRLLSGVVVPEGSPTPVPVEEVVEEVDSQGKSQEGGSRRRRGPADHSRWSSGTPESGVGTGPPPPLWGPAIQVGGSGSGNNTPVRRDPEPDRRVTSRTHLLETLRHTHV